MTKLLIDPDILIFSGAGNKDTEKANMQLYRKLLADFSKLKGMWSKAFFIFMVERADNEELRYCGKKLHFDMKMMDKAVYDRYMKHFIQKMKTDLLNNTFDAIKDSITDAMVNYGNEEFMILNKVIHNTTKRFKFDKVSLTHDMRTLIETSYI